MRNIMRTIAVLLFVVFWCVLASEPSLSPLKEGFSFTQCMNRGFTKEFCVQTPVSYGGPSSCRTPDGHLGQVLAGWGGKCIAPSYASPYFKPYSW